MVARTIAARDALGVRRQVFFVSAGGFDNHAFLSASHPPLLKMLADALDSFYATTVELGVAAQVTTFTASDFGRALLSNGDGSDHGWGAHHLVIGGAVRGGRVYGSFPTVAIGSADDAGHGRLIPTTAVDQYAATLARWMGVSAGGLADILPHLGRFPTGAHGLPGVKIGSRARTAAGGDAAARRLGRIVGRGGGRTGLARDRLLARHHDLPQGRDHRQRRFDHADLHRLRRSGAASRPGAAGPRLDDVFAPVRQAGDRRRRRDGRRAARRDPAGPQRRRRHELGPRRGPLGLDPGRRSGAARTTELLRLRDAEPTAISDATGVTWYSVRLAYFLEPVTAYAPRYATSWVMRVAAARGATPAALAGAAESVIGTATTAAAYAPNVRADALSAALRGCGFFNNPAIFAEGGRLYVVAECLEFDGKAINDARTRMVVLRTRPAGSAPSWTWEYVGVLADRRWRARWAASG